MAACGDFESMYVFAWVSPDGEIVECKKLSHLAVADRIVEERDITAFGVPRCAPDDILLANGWIKFYLAEGRSGIDNYEPVTQSQLDSLYDAGYVRGNLDRYLERKPTIKHLTGR